MDKEELEKITRHLDEKSYHPEFVVIYMGLALLIAIAYVAWETLT